MTNKFGEAGQPHQKFGRMIQPVWLRRNQLELRCATPVGGRIRICRSVRSMLGKIRFAGVPVNVPVTMPVRMAVEVPVTVMFHFRMLMNVSMRRDR